MPSAREILEIRERKAFIEQERENENRQQYEKYVAQENSANSKVAPAHRVAPASFEEFRKAMPDGEPDPNIRGAVASSVVGLRRLGAFAVDRIRSAELSDPELEALGFDISDRTVIEGFLNIPGVAMAFNAFADSESRYIRELHFPVVAAFISRNGLFPSDRHIALTFSHLYDLHLLPEPEPESDVTPELNQFGVNLGIERDPELEAALERKRKREEYGTKIVATGPDGRQYTQFQIDNVLTADESLRVMRFMEGR